MLHETLSGRQRLAVLLRILGNVGYQDKITGHITVADRGDDTLLVNPGVGFWRTICAGDLLRIDSDGRVLEGSASLNPTVLFHFPIHRRRPDAKVIIHNHPPFGTIWSAAGDLPPLLDQTGANGGGRAVLFSEYEGALDLERGEAIAEAYGSADLAILANHGVLVSGDTEPLALVRALSFEWRCRKAYEVACMGRKGIELPMSAADELATYAATYGEMLFDAYGGAEIDRDRSVLE